MSEYVCHHVCSLEKYLLKALLRTKIVGGHLKCLSYKCAIIAGFILKNKEKKPARYWWKIIGKRIEDIPRDKLKISLLQTLYIFGRILLVLFRTKKCALRELFGDLLYILFNLLLPTESTKKTEYGLVEKQNTHNLHKLPCCGNLNYAGNRLTAPEYNSRLHCFCTWWPRQNRSVDLYYKFFQRALIQI